MKKDNKKYKKEVKFPFWIIGLLLPPVGIILYFIKKKKKKSEKESKSILTYSIVGLCIYAFTLLVIINNLPEKSVNDWLEDVKSNKQVVTVVGLTSCTHCQELKPVITKLSKKYKFNLYFFEVDTTTEEENNIIFNTIELKDYDEHVPFTFVIENNEYVSGIIGYSNQEALEAFLVENGVIKKN